MHVPALIKTNKKSPSNQAKAAFNRLRHRIEVLQGKIQNAREECEKALLLYHSDLKPREKELAELITQFILKVRGLTRDSKFLSKKEKRALKNLLADDLNTLFSLNRTFHGLSDEIKEVYHEIHGKSLEKSFQEELSQFKNDLREEGIFDDIDLTDLNPGDSLEELLMKFDKALENLIEKNEEALPKPKTKKELLKEEKTHQLAALQKMGIGNIYKRLAKELHPDLEQDPEKRAAKDLLMKRLTVAYEQSDLLALLALESEWFGHVAEDEKALSDETIKVYNTLLKDQIIDLEQQLKMVALDARYFDIQPFVQDDLRNPIKGINNAIMECKGLMDDYLDRLKDISGNNPIKTLKQILAELAIIQESEKLMEELLDFL